jgi:hypothetical protein
MKFIESKPKSFFYTILLLIFAMFEMGVLSSYRFVEIGGAADKYMNGLTVNQVNTLTQLGAKVGWNFITVSCLIILVLFGYSMLLGYNKNPGGLLAIVIMNLVPSLIGTATSFDFFIGYGTAHLLPAMTIFGLQNAATKSDQIAHALIFCAIICALCVAFWVIGRLIRKSYAAKYEVEFN